MTWWGRRRSEEVAAKKVEALYAALTLNRSITQLRLPIMLSQAGRGRVWGLDGVHCRHLCHMLNANSTLKKLVLYATCEEGGDDEVAVDVDASSAAPASAQQLLSTPAAASWTNSTLQEFVWEFFGDEASNGDDKRDRLRVQVDGAFELIAHLQGLRQLTIGPGLRGVHLSFAWSEKCLGQFKRILTTTDTLTELRFITDAPDPLTMVDCFSHNRGSLRELGLNLDVHGREALFKLLTPGPPSAPIATRCAITNSLQHLSLYNSGEVEHTQEEVEALAAMIANNTSLLLLGLADAKYSAVHWAGAIFSALTHNHTLEELNVNGSPGVDPDHVYEAMLSMLQNNTTLRRIDLRNTPLQHQGKEEAIEAQVQRNREYRAALADLPTMPVKSCRLVMCGYPLAGKSTLCEAICKSAATSQQSKRTATSKQSKRGAISVAVAASAREPTQEEVATSRTRGFEVRLLQDKDEMRINVWDFAGQRHYYALHDFVFPSVNSSTLFLFVYSPVVHRHNPVNNTGQFQYKDSHDFEAELTY